MSDLVLGVALLALVACLLFWLGRCLGRRLPRGWATLLGVAVVVGLLAFDAFLLDNLLLTAILPFANLVVVGNWTPLFLSLLSGLAWSLIPRSAMASGRILEGSARSLGEPEQPKQGTSALSRAVQVRRVVVLLLLQSVGWFAVLRPLWGSPPRCLDRWEGDLCLQTTDSTCTAACAATMLRACGIDASEQEMAALCLTRDRGTLWQGLYRGLKRKTAGTPWEVEVILGPFDRLRSLDAQRPAILAAGIPRQGKVARIYTERYGWTPGEWHSVLFFHFRGNGLVAMGDPTPGIGRENWSEEDLRVLWVGRGMRLVPRTSR